MKLFKNKLNNSKPNHINSIFSINTEDNANIENYLITEQIDGKKLVVLTESKSVLAYSQILEMYKNFFIQSKEFSNIEDFLYRTLLVSSTMLNNISMSNPENDVAPVKVASVFVDNDKYYTLSAGNFRIFKISGKLIKEVNAENKGYEGVSNKISDLQIKTTPAEQLKQGDIVLIVSNSFHKSYENEDKIFKTIKKNKNKANIAEMLVDEAIKNGAKGNVSVWFYVH